MKTEETRRASSPTIACAFPSSLSVTARDLTVSHTSRIEQELDFKTGSVSHGGLFPSYDSCSHNKHYGIYSYCSVARRGDHACLWPRTQRRNGFRTSSPRPMAGK